MTAACDFDHYRLRVADADSPLMFLQMICLSTVEFRDPATIDAQASWLTVLFFAVTSHRDLIFVKLTSL